MIVCFYSEFHMKSTRCLKHMACLLHKVQIHQPPESIEQISGLYPRPLILWHSSLLWPLSLSVHLFNLQEKKIRAFLSQTTLSPAPNSFLTDSILWYIYMWWWACHFLFDSPSGVCPDAFWVYMPLRLMGMMIDVRLIHEAQRSIMRSTHRFDCRVVCFWRQWIGPMISPILKFNLNLHPD